MFIFLSFKSNAQINTKGAIFADVYYGYGSIGNSSFQTYQSESFVSLDYQDIKNHSLGIVGIRGEYLLTEKIGLGFDVGYTSADVTGRKIGSSSVYNPTTTNYDYFNYSYSYKRLTTKFSGILTFNLHFLESDEFDLYLSAGIGYGNRVKKQITDDPYPSVPDFYYTLPITAKVGMGFRYFFNQNFGFNIATSLGVGGTINGGVTYKIK